MNSFSAELRESLHNKYGRVPSAAFLAVHFNRYFSEGTPVSQETTRKWIRGVSMPSYIHLKVLIVWLTLDIRRCFDLDGVAPTEKDLAPKILYREQTMRLAELLNKLPIETQRIVFNFVSRLQRV